MTLYRKMIQESIDIVTTNYGTNLPELDNKKILKGNQKIAGFLHDDVSYSVHIGDEGDVTFGIAKDDLKYISNDRNKTKNVFILFGKVIYVVLEILKKYPTEQLSFDGSDEALSKLYSVMVKNKFLLKQLEDRGYFYDGFEDGLHWFIKED